MSAAFESGARPGEVATGTTIMAVAFDGGVVRPLADGSAYDNNGGRQVFSLECGDRAPTVLKALRHPQ